MHKHVHEHVHLLFGGHQLEYRGMQLLTEAG